MEGHLYLEAETKPLSTCQFRSQVLTISTTFLGFHSRSTRCQIGFLKCSPLKVFFVSSAFHFPPFTLLTGWFDLIAFQSFCLTGHAAYCSDISSTFLDMTSISNSPLRLFVCFGFCALAEFPRGLFKFLDGDGVLMLSIPG